MPKSKLAAVAIALALLASTAMPIQAAADAQDVTVTLPSFPVQLNGITVENAYRQYPLIVYKDITYFPMTYYDNRFLGVETDWSRERGLEIEQTGVAGAYRAYSGAAKNSKTLKAAIRAGELKLNGRTISAANEPYPFLSFRDVTYFPLTWQYAVGEFGWNYTFDSNNGLAIESSNPRVEKLPVEPVSEGAAAIAGGYHYYEGERGQIVRAPIGLPAETEIMYQLPIWSYGDGSTYVAAGLSVNDGEVLLSYHQGGAVMGSDHYLRLNADGVFKEVESGYAAFGNFGDIKVRINQGVPPSPNNLLVAENGEAPRRFGDPAYLYGWHWEIGAETSGGSPSDQLYLVDGQLYVLAFHMESDTDYSRIHKVDLATGDTVRVTDFKTDGFAVGGGMLYFTVDGALMRMPLDGVQPELVELEGKVASITAADDYVICTFVKDAAAPYGMIVIDGSGAIVLRTADEASGISITDDVLIYTESGSGQFYRVNLK